MEDSEKNEQSSDEIINNNEDSAVENAEDILAPEDENIEDAVIVDATENNQISGNEQAEIKREETALSTEVKTNEAVTSEESAEIIESTQTEGTAESEAEEHSGCTALEVAAKKVELEIPVQASESEITNTIREIIAEETKTAEAASEKLNGKPAAVLKELDKLKAESQEKTESEKTAKEEPEAETVSEESAREVIAETSESQSKLVSSEAVESAENNSDCKKRINWSFWKAFAFDIVFLIVCGFFIFAMAQKWLASQQTIIEGTSQGVVSLESGEKNTIGNINILMMGIDSVEGTHRSDTIFVLGVNPSKKKVTMLSIPRDTRVLVENKARKINEILPRYGESTLRSVIEDLLKIKINKKAEVGFESFISVIDTIGGVDINIEKSMNYDDNHGNLHIHFKPGMNHLDGQQALNYVRFRKDAMADLGRIKRQQYFVKAVITKMINPATIVRLPSIIENIFQYMDTDFTVSELLTICSAFEDFDIKLKSLSLPGEARYIDKISFFIPYQEEAIAIGDSYFTDMAVFELEKNFEPGKIISKKTSNRERK